MDSNKPKQVYIQYMSDAWNHFSNHRKEELTHANEERLQ